MVVLDVEGTLMPEVGGLEGKVVVVQAWHILV